MIDSRRGISYLPDSFLMPVQRGASRTINTREESREQTISRRRSKEESLQEKQEVQNWMIKLMLLRRRREREKARKLAEKRGPAMDRRNLWHEIYKLSLAICTPWLKVAVSLPTPLS